jgi:hypothetical protein
MDNDKIQNYINSKSTSALADELSVKLKQYRAAMMDPDATLSIPNLDLMCEYAEVISDRLKG